jgi:hypothetical protein
MRIAGVYLREFEPFAEQPIEFPTKPTEGLAEVHFFVGQNGTGKTRLLSLLAAACGNPEELQYRTMSCNSFVVADQGQITPRYRSFHPRLGALASIDEPLTNAFQQLSQNKFQNSGTALIDVLQRIVSLAFRSIPTLEDKPVTPMGEIHWGERKEFLTFSHHSTESTQLCQAFANLKVRMGMVSGDLTDRTVRLVLALEKAIQAITNQEWKMVVNYANSVLRLRVSWAGKEMQLKQLPDGLRSIIGWLASCVAKLDMIHPDIENPLEQPLILLLDEPDCHLHPAWQRKLIPAIQKLLPNAQLFIATHSPFVISSVNHGWIHIFKADDKGVVTIEKAIPCSAGDSYIDVVDTVLGIHEQFDPETEELLARFRQKRDNLKKSPQPFTLLPDLEKDAVEIGNRSKTLEHMMGQEMAQLKRQLQKLAS